MFKVAVLCSRRAPGLRYLLQRDLERGSLYDVVCCISSEEDSDARRDAEEWHVPFVSLPIRALYRRYQAPLTDWEVRREHDDLLRGFLESFECDLVLLAGYLYIVTEPLLETYAGRLVNIHHSDLTLTDDHGRPRYVGLRAVRDAIWSGEQETRATAHLVTARLDEGPPVLRSWRFPVSPLVQDALRWQATDVLKAYVFAHQEWMLRSAWGPLFEEVIGLFARRRIRVDEGRVFIDGAPGPRDVPRPRFVSSWSALTFSDEGLRALG